MTVFYRIVIGLNIAACVSSIALVAKLAIAPEVAVWRWGDRYKELVFQCDNVMRDHLIAKNRTLLDPSEISKTQLGAAEVALLTCHEYDRLRKRLQIWGVGDAKLADLGLESIEQNAKDVRQFVRTHEIRY